jgi:hypothetical protein
MATGDATIIKSLSAASFRTLAAQARVMAGRIWDDTSKQMMLEVAASYDVLAERAGQRFSCSTAPPLS